MSNFVTITLFALPISYVTSRYAYDLPLIKQAVVVGLWVAYLSTLKQDADAFYSQDTMIQSVMVFILPLKLSEQILCYGGNAITAEDTTKEQQTQPPNLPVWKDFLYFLMSFFYYAIPISKSKQDQFSLKNKNRTNILFWRVIEYLLVVAAKIIMLPVLDAQARQLVASHPDYSSEDFVYWQLLANFTTQVIAGTWIMDIQGALVLFLSRGYYEMLPMYNYPWLSQSVSEFWGQRYNRLINALLKETVYAPLRKLGHSRELSTLAAFGVSGILHSWVSYITFGKGVVRAFAFFVVQVPWIIIERRFLSSVPTLIKRCLTRMFLFGTLPLYVDLFVDNMSQWQQKNPVDNVPEVPVLTGLSQLLIEKLV